MSANIAIPSILQIGAGALGEIAPILARLGCANPLIVSDTVLARIGLVGQLTALLDAAGIAHALFDGTEPEPSDACVMAGVQALLAGSPRGPFDAVIALGGGSVIDTAKVMAVLAASGKTIREIAVPAVVAPVGLPVIAIPTTAGTGSEVTRVAVITEAANDEKLLCMGPGLVAAAAIIDYELTLGLPPRTTADTGLDALTHAIEAHVSRKANPFCDQQALAAMRLIGPNLETVYSEPQNRTAREAVMLGATLAGIAFSGASVALVHGMSRPIGAHFHVPHGLSNAMLLAAVTEFSLAAAPERYAACARAIGFADAGDDVGAAHAKLMTGLNRVVTALEVPTLSGFGIDRARYFGMIPVMVEQALASGSPGNNPRVPTADELAGLYEAVWG
ncbi:iron-containing alcohol dehydrogenase [Maricaulis sp.]|uniref:iron-containing alcohol dehydrogenase n=1 Tax=Maricaulis sp. TaxID=1486257 RepID=UPI003A8D5944